MKRLGPIEEAMKEANDFADNAIKESKGKIKSFLDRANTFMHQPAELEVYEVIAALVVMATIIAVIL